MLKTIEAEVLKKHPSPALQREFAQHDFERLKPFCLLVYGASISIWLAFNLIVSFPGQQGFTFYSMIFLSLLVINLLVLAFNRRVRYFQWINLAFVSIIATGIRLVIEGLPMVLHPGWLILGASTILYSAQVADHVRLGPMTLVMKGESLPARTQWTGVPAAPDFGTHAQKV